MKQPPRLKYVQLDWRFERSDPDAVKRAGHARVHASAVSRLGIHRGGGRNPRDRQRPLDRTWTHGPVVVEAPSGVGCQIVSPYLFLLVVLTNNMSYRLHG